MASVTNPSLEGDLSTAVQEKLIPSKHNHFFGLSYIHTNPGNVDSDSESLGIFSSSEKAEKPRSKLEDAGKRLQCSLVTQVACFYIRNKVLGGQYLLWLLRTSPALGKLNLFPRMTLGDGGVRAAGG